MKPDNHSDSTLIFLVFIGIIAIAYNQTANFSKIQLWAFGALGISICILGTVSWTSFKTYNSDLEKDRRKRLKNMPDSFSDESQAFLGFDLDLKCSIHLADNIRSRHVHIIGATGSGKTESVVLNLIQHDSKLQRPLVILDAKGDKSFLHFLRNSNSIKNRLLEFDLGDPNSAFAYNPISSGNSDEQVHRIMSSLRWSEEFYKEQSRSALKCIFEAWKANDKASLTLKDLDSTLSSPESINKLIKSEEPFTKSNFEQITGLRAQIRSLSSGIVGVNLSPEKTRPTIKLANAIDSNMIVYFRLQALLDSETVATLGRMIVADLASYAGHVHANAESTAVFCPIFLDEFGSLACSSFVDLISKARSAGLALHFSHQSMGDLKRIDPFLMQQVLDNSSTKIVMRIYDPETAEYLAKSFGTKLDKKLTHKIEAVNGQVELQEQGSLREVQAFRASPNQMKYLPTGQGFAFIAHGEAKGDEAASVHRLQFPRLV